MPQIFAQQVDRNIPGVPGTGARGRASISLWQGAISRLNYGGNQHGCGLVGKRHLDGEFNLICRPGKIEFFSSLVCFENTFGYTNALKVIIREDDKLFSFLYRGSVPDNVSNRKLCVIIEKYNWYKNINKGVAFVKKLVLFPID